MPTPDRARALAALKQVELFLECEACSVGDDEGALVDRLIEEGDRIQRINAAFALAVIVDEFAPCSMFRAWASVRRFREWRDAGKLNVIVRHSRCCVKPSEFLAFWRALPDETQRRPRPR